MRTRGAVSWTTAVLPALGILPVAAFAFQGGRGTPLLLVLMLIPTLGGSVGMAIGQRRRGRRESLRTTSRWHDHRTQLLADCYAAADQQRRALDRLHPAATLLAAHVESGSGFERRSEDLDSLVVAIGAGQVPALVHITRSPAPLADCEPALARLAAEAVRTTALLDAAPVSVGLRNVGVLAVTGPRHLGVSVARALVAQLAALHAPNELELAAIVSDPQHWAWAARLAHCRGAPPGARFDALTYGPRGATATGEGDVPPSDQPGAVLGGDADIPDHEPAATSGATHLAGWLSAPADSDRVAIIDGYQPGECSALDLALAEPQVLAIVLCAGRLPARCGAILDLDRLRLSIGADETPLDALETLSLGAADELATAIDAAVPADPGSGPDLRTLLSAELEPLQVPVGVAPSGVPVVLDLREAAEGGHGPHGLLVGATGSGKSVALQTIVAGLVARHRPDELSLLLVDFKGGAAFDRFGALPHVAGMVTNLEEDPSLLDRVRISLDAEMARRQRHQRLAGGPLPYLLVVIDEAGELLASAPEFADTLARIGRIGRSLRMHLLLATQRWDDGKLRGLDAHLRVRLCLRTYTAEDSRSVLGDDSATRLPSRPGAGWLAVDRHRRRVDVVTAPDDLPVATGPVSAPVWLPPLPTLLTHDTLPDTARREGRAVALGIRDLPAEQRQPALMVDLDGPGGHVAVVGGPRSGVSTALRALVVEHCRTHGPDALTIHVIDLGGSLGDLAALPQVGTVAGGADTAGARRVLVATHDELGRRLRDPLRPTPPWLLLIDGLASLRSDDGVVEAMLADLAARGLSVGIHLALGARRWSELRQGTFEACGTRLELRLGDPSESIAGRAAARALPSIPGRGLSADASTFQLITPDTAAVARASGARWPGAQVAPIQPLPQVVDEPPAGADGAFPLGVSGARHESVLLDLLRPGSHVTITGDPRSGRTTVLRRVLAHLSAAPIDLYVLDPRGGLRTASQDAAINSSNLVLAHTATDIALALDHVAAVLAQRSAAVSDAGAEAHPAADSAGRPRRLAQSPVRPLVVIADDTDLIDNATALALRRGSMVRGTASNSLSLPGAPAAQGTTLGDIAAHLPWAENLGLHLVLASPAGGIRMGLDPLSARLRAAAATEIALPTTQDLGVRRQLDPEPAGRARLIQVGERPVPLQCYRSGREL